MKPKANQPPGELEAKLKSVKASTLMTAHVITATPQMTLSDTADLMIKNRVSGLPVIDKIGRLVGVVTITDLTVVMGMVLEGSVDQAGISKMNPTVDYAMSTEIESVREDTSLYDLIRLVRSKNIHTIPVLQDGKLTGVIGQHDILKKFYEIVKTCTL